MSDNTQAMQVAAVLREFCGCKTNAKLRACCQQGHVADRMTGNQG